MMKRKKMMLPMIGMLCASLFSVPVYADKLEDRVPAAMEPGSVLLFDENLQPVVVNGGYLPSDDTEEADYPIEFLIPESATPEETAYFTQENQRVKDNFQSWCPDGYVRAKVYPGMKVVYDENSGDINNIYYADESDPSGYTLHRDDDTKEQDKTGEEICSSLNLNGGTLWVGQAKTTGLVTGSRDSVIKDKDCVTVQDHFYAKSGDNDVLVRNLDTGTSFVFYKIDAERTSDNVLDIWGIENLQTLACKKDLEEPVSVRWYRKGWN